MAGTRKLTLTPLAFYADGLGLPDSPRIRVPPSLARLQTPVSCQGTWRYNVVLHILSSSVRMYTVVSYALFTYFFTENMGRN
jgi:hypothetical protein